METGRQLKGQAGSLNVGLQPFASIPTLFLTEMSREETEFQSPRLLVGLALGY
jgi:hypothetical protein